jgi:thioredoxin 1
MAVKNVGAADFDKLIEDNDIVLVDFWASWCGPCRMFGPIFEKAAEKHPDIAFAKVNTEKEQALAGGLGIRSIPTLMIFRDNILLYSQPGALPAEALDGLIAETRKLDMDDVRARIAQAAAAAENAEHKQAAQAH